jgi:hypothetical protein
MFGNCCRRICSKRIVAAVLIILGFLLGCWAAYTIGYIDGQDDAYQEIIRKIELNEKKEVPWPELSKVQHKN